MKNKKWLITLIAVLAVVVPHSFGGIIYQEDFETLGAGDALPYGGAGNNAGWKWAVEGRNNAGDWVWGHYPDEAANGNIYEVETGQAGPDQGSFTLRSYADYNADHDSADQIYTYLRHEYTVSAADAALGTITFDFDYKNIGLVAASNSAAFVTIQVVDSISGSFAMLVSDEHEIVEANTNWGSGQISIDVAAHEGQLLQFGTRTHTTQWGPSGIALDNVDVQSIPEPATMGLVDLAGGAIMVLRRLFGV
ncbi:MAG: hypothetical protein CBE26_03500 [Kiritimatiellaceae bacterium TMED266]|nr:MAG: hypothetical protein CBE26_03500 [Kiritimatiellaceae bacterium TMED266]